MYDPSDIVDAYFYLHSEGEPTYRQSLWVDLRVMAKIDKAVTRYEKRLGRPLTQHEGQVLMHALSEPDPQRQPGRFHRCVECGVWIDLGTLGKRIAPTGENEKCEYCSIPF